MKQIQVNMDSPLLDQLEVIYKGRVVIWRMDDGTQLYLDQNSDNMTKGWVIAELKTVNEEYKYKTDVRRLTQKEYATIESFWMGEAEPHDFDAYKNDEYAVD